MLQVLWIFSSGTPAETTLHSALHSHPSLHLVMVLASDKCESNFYCQTSSQHGTDMNRYDSIWDQLVPAEFLNMPKLCSLCKKHVRRFLRECNVWNKSWQLVASKTIRTYGLYRFTALPGPLWTLVSWADGPERLFFDPTPVLNMSQSQTSNRTSHFKYWKALVQRSKVISTGQKKQNEVYK